MISVPLTPDLIRGIAELEPTNRGLVLHRLPAWVRRQLPDPQLMSMEVQPSGARVAFRTTATRVELEFRTSRVAYIGADRPRGRVDAFIDGVLVTSDEITGGDAVEVDLVAGTTVPVQGDPHTTVLAGLAPADKLVELWLPNNEAVTLVALQTDAPVSPDERPRRRWVHHGSSISQGSAATNPSLIWPALAARAADLELRNLGFGGSAMADQCVARVIRDTPADVISIKLGINIVNADAMRMRALVPAVHGFLDTVRDGHPETPLFLVTPIYCPIHEDTPGPGAFDTSTIGSPQVRFIATGDPAEVASGRLTLRSIRDALTRIAVTRNDPNLYLIDGLSLFGPADEAERPLADALHPDTASHELIGTRFADQALASLG
ncbi:SGNH/GDSL hydrolase family protein [Tessaracoccus palaemonis]|uniref:Lipase n=1 Tax=Tessaracoccus palaemonis TaxID=2829499 RepID=A0ABX8SS66_9ACTN|nr:SGNH/GDSL hydrolase family protein [Tessaracoccus palaemonis]QXT64019.1 lipase [Tessaracoccus palaemonis]